MGALEALGRTNFNQSVGMVLEDLKAKRQMAQDERRTTAYEQMSGMQMKGMELDQELKANQLRVLRDEENERKRKVPTQPYLDNFMGGANGEIAKLAKGLANSFGYIDANGNIEKGHMLEIANMIHNPPYANDIAGLRVKYTQNEYQTLTEAAKNPEALKKLKESNPKISEKTLPSMIENARTAWEEAVGANDALMKRIKQMQDEQDQADKLKVEQEKAAAATKSADAAMIRANKPGQGKELTPIQSVNELGKRFFAQDWNGNFIVTSDAAGIHRVAKKKLDELLKQGVTPLTAVNQAEESARNAERGYWIYIEQTKDKSEINKIKTAYRKKYGYIPTLRPVGQ